MEKLWQDIRYSLRMLRKSPGFAAVAVLTLALGIGANTAIFSIVNAVLLRPLSFPHSERLVFMWGKFALGNQAAISPADLADYRAENHSFDFLGGFSVVSQPSNLATTEKPIQVTSTLVTAGLFDALGVHPALGRTFSTADEQVRLPQTVILSHRLWQQQFEGDPAIIGKSIVLDSQSVTVIGVMPASLHFLQGTEVWIPAPYLFPEMASRRAHFLRPVGRLKDGVTMAQAQADLDIIAQHLGEQYPATNAGWSTRLQPLQEVLVGDVRPALLILLGAAGIVLLIGCANVANLLLARATGRAREFAVRRAIGARNARLVRQLLTESLILALAGGLFAILLAVWSISLLHLLPPDTIPRLDEIRLDTPVFIFTAVLSILTGILFGMAPAMQTARGDLQETLKEGGRTSTGSARHALRSILVVSEVALSLALLIGAGLLLKSFWRLMNVNPGFNAEKVLTAQVVLPIQTYKEDGQRSEFFRQVLDKVSAIPGVESAGAISELPLTMQFNDTFFDVREHPTDHPQDHNDADFRVVTPDYFRAMRIPLLEGHIFSEQDSSKAPKVVIVNKEFMREYFPNESPLGQHLMIFEGAPEFVTREIVGVVGGVRHFALQQSPRPEMYVPEAQAGNGTMNLVIRSTADPKLLSGSIRDAVASVDKTEAVGTIQAMNEIVSNSASGDRLNTLLVGIFAAMALLLAAAGIYGVISYSVSQRIHEIGVRLALGAQPSHVMRLVVGQGMRLAGLGLALGMAAAWGATRLLSNLLFGVAPRDPLTFATVTMILATVALAACYLPARRAMRVDPMVALRYE